MSTKAATDALTDSDLLKAADALLKSGGGHKYTKRTGAPGHFQYEYGSKPGELALHAAPVQQGLFGASSYESKPPPKKAAPVDPRQTSMFDAPAAPAAAPKAPESSVTGSKLKPGVDAQGNPAPGSLAHKVEAKRKEKAAKVESAHAGGRAALALHGAGKKEAAPSHDDAASAAAEKMPTSASITEAHPDLEKYRSARERAAKMSEEAGSPNAEGVQDSSAHSIAAAAHREAADAARKADKEALADAHDRHAKDHSKAAVHAAHAANARKDSEEANEADGKVEKHLGGEFTPAGAKALEAAANDASHKHHRAAENLKAAGLSRGGHAESAMEHSKVADYAYEAAKAHDNSAFTAHNRDSAIAKNAAIEQHQEAAKAARKLGARGERLAQLHDDAAAAHEGAPTKTKKQKAPLGPHEAVAAIDPEKLRTAEHFEDAAKKIKALHQHLKTKLGFHPASSHASKAQGLADAAYDMATKAGAGKAKTATIRTARSYVSDSLDRVKDAEEQMPAHLRPGKVEKSMDHEVGISRFQDRSAGPPARGGVYDGLGSGMVDATVDRPRWVRAPQAAPVDPGVVEGGRNTQAYQKPRQMGATIELAKSAVIGAIKDGYRMQLIAVEDANPLAKMLMRNAVPGDRPMVPAELRKSVQSGSPDPEAVVAFAAAALTAAAAKHPQLKEGLSRLGVSRRTLRDTLEALSLNPAGMTAGY